MELMSRRGRAVDYEHLPFREFTIQFPMHVFLSKEQVFDDTVNRIDEKGIELHPNKLIMIEGYAQRYVDGPISIHFSYEDLGYLVKVTDIHDIVLFQYSYYARLYLPNVQHNEFAGDGIMFAIKMTNLINSTLAFIQEPSKEVIVHNTKEYQKRGTTGSASGKSYIHKKTYKVLNIESELDKRDYHRIIESWGVRGHWRHYKSGKAVWIKEHTKGDKEVGPKTYRITKVKED